MMCAQFEPPLYSHQTTNSCSCNWAGEEEDLQIELYKIENYQVLLERRHIGIQRDLACHLASCDTWNNFTPRTLTGPALLTGQFCTGRCILEQGPGQEGCAIPSESREALGPKAACRPSDHKQARLPPGSRSCEWVPRTPGWGRARP